jgi:DNA mismatch repair protein MutS2
MVKDIGERRVFQMNERTLRILEFYKIIDQVAELAGTSLGKELVREIKPLNDVSAIKEAQHTVSEAVKILVETDRVPLGGIFDVRDAVKKAALSGVLSPQELMEIGSTLRASRLMREFLMGKQDSLSAGGVMQTIIPLWGGNLAGFPAVERELERCIGPSGEILDNASAKLHSLRSQLKVIQNRIRDKLDSLVHSSENSKYLQDQIVTVRNERYCIPVKQEYRSLFPGIVHDQSSSGATLFVEPLAVVELNNQLRMVEADELDEISRILSELSGRIKEISASLLTSINILARLDMVFAKGRYSLAIRGVEPELNQENYIALYHARHPLLTGKVVPITVTLGKDYDTLVITGPNTGGKTVSLKTIGLLTLMAQAGLHIPADIGSTVAPFAELFCDIGDEQSIEQSLSTFSSHLTQIVKIIQAATGPKFLVLLDELGAGTDPAEGAALAMSILTHLHNLKVRTVATTHYSELKAFAYQTPGIENAAVEFDIETLRPTYHLLTGLPGSSQAFEIAQKLGLPDVLIDNARSYISSEAMKVEDMLHQIENDQRRVRENRRVSEEARLKGERFKSEYETAIEKFKREKAELLRQAKAEAREILLEARRESENLLRQLREASPEKLSQIVNEARTRITNDLTKIDEETAEPVRESRTDPAALKAGSKVHVISLNQNGTILELNAENALVQIGIIKANLPLTDLELVSEELVQVKPRRKSGATGLETTQNISAEINVIGLTVDEALYQVEKYLDQAVLAGLKRFRIVHGKGTGALRQAIQGYMRDNPVVKSTYIAEQNEGGLGASIVELR